MKEEVSIFWFRRDLRLYDNAGLYQALKGDSKVLPVFIFDREILDELDDKHDRRVQFIHDSISAISKELSEIGSSIEVHYGFPLEVFKLLSEKYTVSKVYTNHDYEPYAKKRDGSIVDYLSSINCQFLSYKDQVIFEKSEVVKDNGEAYTVFTPYSRKWLSLLDKFQLKAYPVEKYKKNFFKQTVLEIPSMEAMGFKVTSQDFPGKDPEDALIRHYHNTRNIPGINGTSRLGVHLRFGTLSIREVAKRAKELNPTYLNEIIWRDFYQAILWNFPQIGEHKAFKPAYDNINWRNNEEEFKRWCEGSTGYPIVDAGMRELNNTGFMHNRVRMVVASFLVKHLLIDWRWGEEYFAKKLLDFDMASNNGGWQWAAGSGCDAAPYFRVFNPYLQTKKFDPDLAYVKMWVPEFQEFDYPSPIVEHDFARKRALEEFGKAIKLNAS